MRSFAILLKKYFIAFSGFILLLIIVNMVLLVLLFQRSLKTYSESLSPAKMAEKTAYSLSYKNNKYIIDKTILNKLESRGIWSMLMDNNGEVVWDFDLPKEIKRHYSIADVAQFSRYYLEDYPVFVWKHSDGLLVIGYPKDSVMKISSNYFPIDVIKTLPIGIAVLAFCDVLMLFGIYSYSKLRLNKAISPLVISLQSLAKGEPVNLKQDGELSEVILSINQASLMLKKKDSSRANWIAGVSHDIRTPLTMSMGYADKLWSNKSISPECRDQAKIILRQSTKIKELVDNLNLFSNLEYLVSSTQFIKLYPIKIIRTVIADFLNNGLEDIYSIDLWVADVKADNCMHGDERLIIRAISNLIQNSITHNPEGCNISVKISLQLNNQLSIEIADDGVGLSAQELIKIQAKKHYIMGDNPLTQQHGMGLLIVRQIVELHGGKVMISSKPNKGFCTKVVFGIEVA
ncbi:HAMP domain-containing histidine kinase [Clostridium sp. FP2]|uniref:sensor histidine kinase n=1 Tax=Clostridium sp. FP2 TaxID=2724481 RepID=UPI0013E96C90|nr:HAMP domain-containing sensor histidine kinase [Clostridium sp. FP2]MBZ9623156.1 HAMP domain-containing histidine kinase [Clostridium sp. FP2]